MTPNIVKGSNSLPSDRSDDPNHPRNNPDYIPNSLKDQSAQESSSAQPSSSSSGMDGDHAAKTMEAGANAAVGSTEMSSGIHEDANQQVSDALIYESLV